MGAREPRADFDWPTSQRTPPKFVPCLSPSLSFLNLWVLLLALPLSAQTFRDPADQPFRRAPMSVAARSVVIPLATNVHLAFDTETLRSHTAWRGPSLNLHGAPYDGAAGRFLADFTGESLFTNPPLFPWAGGKPARNILTDFPSKPRFLGLSTRGGVRTLMYELPLDAEETVRVHESPSVQFVDGMPVVVRRFELSASYMDLEFTAHMEAGRMTGIGQNNAAMGILREKDVLLTAFRGRPLLGWKPATGQADYVVELLREKDGDAETLQRHVTGDETHAVVHIPAHRGEISFEVLSVVCADKAEAERLLPKLIPAKVAPPELVRVSEPPASKPTNQAPTLVVTNAPAVREEGGFRVELLWSAGVQPAIPLHPNNPPVGHRRSAPDAPITGMDFMPNGDLAFCTARGEVFIRSEPANSPGTNIYRHFARGLMEPAGLRVLSGEIFVAQKCELTRLRDTDGDGEADLFECVSQAWGFTGGARQFATGPVADKEGRLHVFLDGRGARWEVPFRGWDARFSRGGKDFEGWANGFLSPGGALAVNGDVFVTDNAGPWVPAAKLIHVQESKFQGHPSTQPAPQEQFKEPKEFAPPAVWFPTRLAKHVAGMAVAPESWGAFAGQVLVADGEGGLLRVSLEQVNGEWQGAAWPLVKGLGANASRLAVSADGKLYFGGATTDGRALVLGRMSPAGPARCETKTMKALADGFELTFTQPVDSASAAKPVSYEVSQFNYRHEIAPGAEHDFDGTANRSSPLKVAAASVAADGLSVRLKIPGLRAGFVTSVRAAGVRSAAAQPLRSDAFFHTLNQVPK
ncbi:MAG: hypothetical protein FD161_3308 [Limisphaerales bacterium]|nr:MAG: hypothetical protein FD161_3308 [Limisphaerales bacterium]KAG0507823.1 MAG: hypothetical protein E1N63_2974 [Limisphaerales bacterium]